MGNIAEKLNIDLNQLSPKEKAELAHFLIEELDNSEDSNLENIWLKEAEKRYSEYRNGSISAEFGRVVFERARNKLV